eukprot:gene5250-6533_t
MQNPKDYMAVLKKRYLKFNIDMKTIYNMEELELLRKRLSSLQKEQSAQKLSERNCIEIIMKMIDLKMVDIIYTLNGKEYVTPKQLELEISDEILRSGGRVSINDLQPLLNIDLKFIQEKVNKLVKKDKSMTIYYGEIITKYYLDSVVEEIEESLQETGRLHINDLSAKFSLNADILEEAIKARLGRLIHGVFDSEVIYTQAHVDRHKHKVIGLFSATTKPVVISQLYQIEELINCKRLSGVIQGKGSNAEYVPTIYSQTRLKWIDSFYTQNSYISYDSLTKLQINDPVSILKSIYKEGIALKTCFTNQFIIDKVDDSISEIIQNPGWIDISPSVPSPFSNKDIEIVINSCPSMKDKENPKAIILNDTFIVSTDFIDRCFTLLHNEIQQKLEKQQKLQESIAATISTGDLTTDTKSSTDKQTSTTTTTTTGGKKDKKGGKKQQDSDEDEKPTKISKSHKGGNKKGKKGKRVDDSDDDEDFNQQQQQQQKSSKSNTAKKLDHFQEIVQLLSKWYENMEEELIQSLSQYLRPKVNQAWETMVKEAKEKLDNENQKVRKAKQQTLVIQISSQYSNLQLFKKGLDELDESNSVLHKHLLKTVCTNIVNLLIEVNASYNMLEETSFDTPAQRSSILSSLPPQLSKNLDKLLQQLNKQSVDDFLEILTTVLDQSQIKLKPQLDKKTEKTLLTSHQEELKEQLNVETDLGNMFQIVVILIYINYKNHIVHAPPRAIGTLITALTNEDPKVDEETGKLLSNVHQDIVKLIINKNNDDESVNQDQLKKNLDTLKAFALK